MRPEGTSTLADDVLKTPLYDLHVELGAKMVPFAGYSMPVQYPMGVLKEHLHTREKAGLFDVSHMGQAYLSATGEDDVARVFESLVPGNISGLKPNAIRYTMFLNDEGGILDDLMATRWAARENTLFLVVNAACKDQDFALMSNKLAGRARLDVIEDRALLALQGPAASSVLAGFVPEAAEMGFMTAMIADYDGVELFISRSGYTGEDGYEISVPADKADAFARALLAHDDVEPIGLGARDSLRLEAGLCLYGHDIDTTTSPVEGDLTWAVAKARREAADFPGAARILGELANGTSRKRVGIQPEGRAPAREGVEIVDADGNVIGKITSGGFGPTAGGPVAMGYVTTEFSEIDTEVGLSVRGKIMPAKVASLPFVQQRYYRKPKV